MRLSDVTKYRLIIGSRSNYLIAGALNIQPVLFITADKG